MHGLPLTPEVLVAAYANAIFPMDVEGSIQWFSPDPRAIIELDAFHEPGNIAQLRRSGRFEIRIDTAFEDVIRACADRPEGTWISEPIVKAYCQLHRLGTAHSVESWREGTLEGGLYGVALGGAFFGESMFYRSTDASKVALAALVERLRERGYQLLDIQFLTPHLAKFGAVEISRDDYTRRLKKALRITTRFVD